MKRRRDFVLSFTEDFIPSRYATEAFSPLEVGRQWPSCLSKLLLGHTQGKPCSPVLCPDCRPCHLPALRAAPSGTAGRVSLLPWVLPAAEPALASCPLHGDADQLAHNK